MASARVQIGRRFRQLRALWRLGGVRGVTDRVQAAAAKWLTPKDLVMPVRREDVLAADISRPPRVVVPSFTPGQQMTVNWVTIPAGPKSGGHTTIFRIIRYLEAHGYRNRVYFYNVQRGDHAYYESFVRSFYGFHGPVADVDQGMEDAHAVVATSWPTAYPVFNSRCAGKRFYFVQDFEPYFYPLGALSCLAENTYRMGLHGIMVGQCFAEKLRTEYGMTVDCFDYGCDTSRYHPVPGTKRSGVVFYARSDAARRGFELGLMAMELFARRHPEIELHFYGNRMGKLPFRFIDHGRVTPDELNNIYSRCYAGLTLSLTNVSLVAYEMLAAGCIPVVNDTLNIRMDLKSAFVRYAAPYPAALASELEALVTMPDFESLSKAAVASVRTVSWDEAGAVVDAVLRRALVASQQEGQR